jgi:hypothetical protein
MSSVSSPDISYPHLEQQFGGTLRACSARASWSLVVTRSAGLWPGGAGAWLMEERSCSLKLESGNMPAS